jgi:hypothetical protein
VGRNTPRPYWVAQNYLEFNSTKKLNRSTLASSKCRQDKCRLHFFPFRPIVIGVALKAPRLRVLRSRRVTSLASRNPRQKHVAGLRAVQRFLVTAHARKTPVRVMIKSRVRHPLQHRPRRFYDRQIILARSTRQRMTLLASLPPQKFLGIIDPRRNPLVRRVHSHRRLR